MIYSLYSMRDVLTGFMVLTMDNDDATAKRNFEFAMTRDNSLYAFKPQDYSLWKLGDFDTDLGVISPLVPPQVIMQGVDCHV